MERIRGTDIIDDDTQFLFFFHFLGTKQIHAHRLVLCTASDYFAAKFTSSLKESVQNEVEMMEVDGEALLTFVEYCYTGKNDLDHDFNYSLSEVGAFQNIGISDC